MRAKRAERGGWSQVFNAAYKGFLFGKRWGKRRKWEEKYREVEKSFLSLGDVSSPSCFGPPHSRLYQQKTYFSFFDGGPSIGCSSFGYIVSEIRDLFGGSSFFFFFFASLYLLEGSADCERVIWDTEERFRTHFITL